jgi:hypothetical protein
LYRARYPNPVFYVVSDDPQWTAENLEAPAADIFFAGSQKRMFDDDQDLNDTEQIGLDLALLSQGSILSVPASNTRGRFYQERPGAVL